ncbi:hypothetical protein QL285_010593 [Trifolium repens]|nr:hypothetical protein QL285_010593 [Trifolium repens]
MASRVVLSLLPFVFLLFILNGHGSFARDMKIQQENVEEKQAYLDRWLKDGQKENSVYLDGWLKDGQKEKFNPIYLDGWLKDGQKEKVYLDGWLKDGQNEKSNSVYLDGWLKDGKKEKVYLDGWLKDGQKEKSNSVYLDGWLKDGQKEKVYLDGWLKDGQKEKVYLDGWLKDGQKEKFNPNSNQVYLDGWLKDSQNEKSNSAYLDGWLKDGQKEKIYLDGWLKDNQAKSTPNSIPAYLDGWLKDSQIENTKGELTSKVDHTEAFKMAFFGIEDLYPGNVMTLSWPIREYANFLPKKVADSIPLSKSQIPSLLQLFTLKDSPDGVDVEGIVDQCEAPPQKGEVKACPTSLESMVEFVHSVIGKDAKYNVLTTQYPTTSATPQQNYTVLEVSKDIYAPKWVACHPRPYPIALYYCHYLDIGSKIFKVLLKGQYGDTMEALGICHLDTADMPANHIIFQYLKMKPGDGPLCHFFPVKHLVWVPLPSEVVSS